MEPLDPAWLGTHRWMEQGLFGGSCLGAARRGGQAPPSSGTGSPRNRPPVEVEKQSVSKLPGVLKWYFEGLAPSPALGVNAD